MDAARAAKMFHLDGALQHTRILEDVDVHMQLAIVAKLLLEDARKSRSAPNRRVADLVLVCEN